MKVNNPKEQPRTHIYYKVSVEANMAITAKMRPRIISLTHKSKCSCKQELLKEPASSYLGKNKFLAEQVGEA